MTKISRLLVILVITFLGTMVSGCTFSAPQFESAISLAQGIIASDEATSTDQPAKWFASVDGTGAVLSSYVSGDLIVFANADGDAVAFDGWTIRSVMGFGLASPLSISGRDGNRTFSAGGQIMSTECDPWYLRGLTWHQTCANGDGEIVLNPEGNIELIFMSLGENLGIVTLRVAK